jgi:hypothetical protein
MSKSIIISLCCFLLGHSQPLVAIPEAPSKSVDMGVSEKQRLLPSLKAAIFNLSSGKQDSLIQERPSKLAKTSVSLLVASFAGTMVLGGVFMPLAYVGLAGILVANILAIIVLGRKPNKKSKKYARGILIITGIMIASALLLIGAINLLFPGAI